MFAIDALGALVSTVMLGIVLPLLQPLIGIPNRILFMLASIAFCFCVYSFSCYRWARLVDQKWLLGIIFGNSAYCVLTAVLLFSYKEQVALLGGIYFLSEIIILIGVVVIEKNVFRKTYPQ